MKTDAFLQALNQCAENKKCECCPLASNPHCRQELMVFAHGTINRLYHNIQLTAKEQYTNGRNDGIREFAARLKDMRKIVFEHLDDMDVVFVNEIDGLVEEMTEVHNAKENSV